MTVGQIILRREKLRGLFNRLSDVQDAAEENEAAQITLTVEDLSECMQCVTDTIRFINNTVVNL